MDDDRLADVVNHDPVVFYDCTQPELMGAFCASGLFTVLCTVLLTVITGYFLFSLVGSLVLTLGFCWAVLTVLKNVRQKYYATWLKENVFLIKQEGKCLCGLPSQFFNKSVRFGKGGRRG